MSKRWRWRSHPRFAALVCALRGHKRSIYWTFPTYTTTEATSLIVERCARCGLQENLL